ncbi:MAG TPA: hypothetical protein VKT30_04885 [Caulobacteraceae bacterium]|nr:hypothetical protein [Caulobacteraceae bacterium]
MAISNAQTQSNLATAQNQAILNNVNQVTPFGTVAYTQPGGPNTPFTETVSLSPQEQAIFNQGTANQAQALGIAGNQLTNVQNALNTPVTPVEPLATGVTAGPIQYGFNPGPGLQYGFAGGAPIQSQIGNADINQSVQNAANAAYAQAASRLDPQWTQNAEQQQAQLTAQGLNPNDAAFQNSMTLFNNARNDAYNQAALSAIGAGDAEQNTLFGQQAQQGQFANAAQAQGFAQNQAQANFANAAAAQQYAQNQGVAGFANAAQNQAFGQNAANANLYNAAAQQQFQDQAYAQQLPINEFDALMSSSQVQAPTSTPAQTQVQPTNVLGAYQLQQNAEQADYQSQLAAYDSGLNGLFGLGTAALKLIPGFP